MAISQETRRRIVLIVVALIVVAMVLASTGCSSVSGTDQPGQAGQDRDGPAPLEADFYPAAVTRICATTDERLAELPTPGDGMAENDWAGEVSLVLEAEATALGEVGTISSVRDDHRAFITNTSDQAAQWSLLSAAIAAADADGIDAARTEILELSRGRIELAAELGISGCRERSVG
jgi:hypothetical protein